MKLFKEAIRIPGRDFDDLNAHEVCRMIEADSSMSPEGNESFDPSALDIFLYNARLTHPRLMAVREEILRGIYKAAPGTRVLAVDTDFLKEVASRIGREQW